MRNFFLLGGMLRFEEKQLESILAEIHGHMLWRYMPKSKSCFSRKYGVLDFNPGKLTWIRSSKQMAGCGRCLGVVTVVLALEKDFACSEFVPSLNSCSWFYQNLFCCSSSASRLFNQPHPSFVRQYQRFQFLESRYSFYTAPIF